MSYDDDGALDVQYFKPRSIKQNSVIFIIGKRGSGKSTVAESIMRHHRNIKEGVCISKTDKMNRFWSKHIPELFVHHKYSPKITDRILTHQEKRWAKIERRCIERGEEPDPANIPPVFAIYDDVTYDKSFLRDDATRELFMNGRHYNIMVIITCQYLMDMGPDLRNQIDYVIILKDNIRNNRFKMFEYFAGVFNNYYLFEETFLECTKDREALVIWNSGLSHELDDCVWFYKAKPGTKYRLCHPSFWEYSKNNATRDKLEAHHKLSKYAGMSKSERERLRMIQVKKIYPKLSSRKKAKNKRHSRDVDDEGEGHESDEDSDGGPVLLANPERMKSNETRRREHQKKMMKSRKRRHAHHLSEETMFGFEDQEQQQEVEEAKRVVDKIVSKSKRKESRTNAAAAISSRIITAPKETKKKHKKPKRLRTALPDPRPGYEPYGRSILRELKKEHRERALPKKQRPAYLKKQKNKRKQEAIAKEARRKREKLLRSQLFLY